MRKISIVLICFSLVATLCLLQNARGAEGPQVSQQVISATEMNPVERGKHLVMIAGCNDCHTKNYLTLEGNVPEAEWLEGSSLGWSGPWGTTYAVNLREFIQPLTEQQWVDIARMLKARPPMPWWELRELDTRDLAAIYQCVKQLGPSGEAAPTYLPPGQKPNPPYAEFVLGPAPAPTSETQK